MRAIADLEIFLSSKTCISASLPVSFLTFDLLPFGRPSTTPSVRLRTRASFVRWETRVGSISAVKPKAMT
jgi:hypothetical protein